MTGKRFRNVRCTASGCGSATVIASSTMEEPHPDQRQGQTLSVSLGAGRERAEFDSPVSDQPERAVGLRRQWRSRR